MLLIEQISTALQNPKRILTGDDQAERKRHALSLRTRVIESRRFYANEDVSRSAARLGLDNPDILMGMLRNARLPFEKVWIEWHNRAHIEETGDDVADDAPEKIGAFIQRIDEDKPIYRMNICGMDGKGYGVAESPLSYIWNAYEPIEDILAIPDTKFICDLMKPVWDEITPSSEVMPERMIRISCLGSAYSRALRGLTSNTVDLSGEENEPDYGVADHYIEQTNQFSNHFTIVLNPALRKWLRNATNHLELRKYIARDLIESAGTVRYVVSLLAMINQGDYISREPSVRPSHKRMMGNRLVPYLDHWTVTMKVPRKIAEQKIRHAYAERASTEMPRQEIIGHWKQRHNTGDPNCEHVFVPKTHNHEHCALCGRFRWHVKEYMRGNAEIGFVTKDRLLVEAK